MSTNIAAQISAGLVTAALTMGCAAHSAQAHPAQSSAGSYAQVNGLSMYYEVHGSGRPLVLLHGGGSTLDTTFGKMIPSLAKNRRVVAIEQQAHGRTADIDRPLSLEQMAEDTAALLAQLKIDEADFFGFSNGGQVAMHLAIRHPKLVRKLVVASTFYKRDACPPAFWDGFAHATLESMPLPLREGYLKVAPHPEALPTYFKKSVSMMMGFKEIDPAALRTITAPTLVMIGDSEFIRVEHAVEMTRVLPHAQLAVFPGETHGSYLGAAEAAKEGSKAPERTASIVDDFLGQ